MIEKVCDFIRRNTSSDLSLSSLAGRFGLTTFGLQRSFKEVMGISPRRYVEECRINLLKQNLRDGQALPEAVYKTGYNSQSWLYDDPNAKLGMNPSSYRKGGEGVSIRYLTTSCRFGYLLVAETEHGICALSMSDSERNVVENLRREYPKASISLSESVRNSVDSVLDYFDGQLLSLPVDIDGTEFQKRVWAVISTIPYGETRTYNQIAEAIGSPKAFRAVANACGSNPVPLIIPCHRVVRKDGKIGGYALGPDRKRELLKMERERKSSL